MLALASIMVVGWARGLALGDLLLAALYSAPSTLALIPFQDVMGTRERINVPGTVDEANWRYRSARGVDDLLADAADLERLRKLADEAGRLWTQT